MFCGKCGKEIPDDVEFCPKCGSKVKNVADKSDEKPAVEEKHTDQTINSAGNTTLEKESGSNRKGVFIIGGIIIAAIIAVIVLISTADHTETIDLNKYVSITTDGYDGYGTAQYELDTDALCSEFISKYKLKERDSELGKTIMDISNGLGLTDIACAEAFMLQIGAPELSQTDNLSNGDTITVSWKTLESNNSEYIKNLLKDNFCIKIEGTHFSYKVEDLKPVQKIDPFSDVDLKFVGVEGFGYIKLDYSADNDLQYVIESESQTYSNGDEIGIKVLPPEKYNDWESYTIDQGISIENDTTKVKVSGLKPVEHIDPFEGIEFSFEGLGGTRAISVVPKTKNGFNFSIGEVGKKLHNGDEVTIEAKPAADPTWDEYTVNTANVPDRETMKSTVKGLSELITRVDQIPEDYHKKMIEYADKQASAYVGQRISSKNWPGKQDEFDVHYGYSDPVLCKEYLLSSQEEMINELIFLYRVDYHVVADRDVRLLGQGILQGEAEFPVYFGFKFDAEKMIVEADGKVEESDLSGEILAGLADNLMVYYELVNKEKDNEYVTDEYFLIIGAYILEQFEMKYIDVSAMDKDIVEINTYNGPMNVKEIKGM